MGKLITQFHNTVEDIGQFLPVRPSNMTADFRRLLHHERHMTPTLRFHFDSPLGVEVVNSRHDTDRYQREILLRRVTDGVAVEFGLLNADLARLPDSLSAELLAGKHPFGQLIVDQRWQTSVSVDQLWRIEVGPALAAITALSAGDITFGRLASIMIDSVPAIEVLEIILPDQSAEQRRQVESRRIAKSWP
ncbi:MAG: hypothetical protein ACFHX7_07115 [Pseudomonadota bacterium]